MGIRTTQRLAALCAAATAVGGLAVAQPTGASAAPSDIVISELMYHAVDPDPLEFIELANRGSDPVDISGWSFGAGITLPAPFPAGTVVPGGSRVVGAPDAAVFEQRYGFAPDFTFAGTSLSNGGEQVTLVDDSSAVVDEVTYDDAAPWPVSPDGAGPSLELLGLSADNADAASWAPSQAAYGTPRAVNSVELNPPAGISQVTASPQRPAPNQAVTVSARATLGAAVTLTTKVMFGPDTTRPMLDDAASPGGAGDGVYAATVPGVPAGQLLRYRVDVVAGSSTAAHPPAGDSRRYEGVVATDPEQDTAKYRVLEWFMADADYNDLLTNHRCDGVDAPAVIAWQGKVFDGALMHIRGQSSCTDAKVKWDVTLPKGHLIDLGAPYAYPMDEFALNSKNAPIPGLGWKMVEEAGNAPLRYSMVRTHRNGDFYSVVELLEKYDNVWRGQRGYDDWAIYKVDAGGLRTYATPAELEASLDLDKKNGEGDYTDAWELTQWLAKPDSAAKRAWLHEHVDISQMVNFMALVVAMRQWDVGGKNFYIVRDVEGDGRWRLLHWDLDGIFSAGRDGKGDLVTPTTSFNKLHASLLAIPEVKAMHFRRVRTLHDRFLVGNGLLSTFDSWTTCCASDISLDRQRWGTPSLTNSRQKVVDGVQERRDQIAAHTGQGEIPVSQTSAPAVVINEIQYAPANPAAEYVELHNPSTTESVDLSDWVLEGVGSYAIPPGTVLLPGAYAVFVKDDPTFRSVHGPALWVGGEYPGSLGDTGGTVRLRQGSRVVDEVAYSAAAPWPSVGGGSSLELKDPALDNADPPAGPPAPRGARLWPATASSAATAAVAAGLRSCPSGPPGATWPPAATWAPCGEQRPTTTPPGRPVWATSASATATPPPSPRPTGATPTTSAPRSPCRPATPSPP
ncbi:lamin tail domain-containing protein [Knoellia sp. 3-2P3]|uniref:lamin tail domain-containing protein n=1 Tax=unclassified Knoellia TaxID=2618719 RepID=UPI0023DC128C|nr:lamin tail domain-containing protein [Knoellia sp. 3-2P3]MDF2093915.1 lamin tail domain-containing protein [Knoellia sp. 3-2P3]